MTVATPEVADILEHHGVKGMKWGVRTAKRIGSAIALQVQEASWQNHLYSTQGMVDRHNAAADHFNSHIDKLNNSPKYRDKNLLERKNATLKHDYDRDAEELMHRANEHAVKTVHGVNPKKTQEVSYNRKTYNFEVGAPGGKKGQIETLPNPVEINLDHAATPKIDVAMTFKTKLDANGKIIQVNRAKLEGMSQADGFIEAYLEHYGVKGMRWGKTTKSGPTSEVSVTQKGKKLKTSGGEGVKPHADAVTAAKTKQQVSASGVHSVSNKDLQALAQRMNLEQQVDRLAKNEQANSANFIQKMLHQSGQQEAQKASNALVAKSVSALLKSS